LPAYSASEKLIWPIVLLAPCAAQRSRGVIGGLVQTFPNSPRRVLSSAIDGDL
jgi:hypothetical protein